MFDEVTNKGSWVPSFLLQQVLATFVCSLIASLIALPMFAAGWIGYFFVWVCPPSSVLRLSGVGRGRSKRLNGLGIADPCRLDEYLRLRL